MASTLYLTHAQATAKQCQHVFRAGLRVCVRTRWLHSLLRSRPCTSAVRAKGGRPAPGGTAPRGAARTPAGICGRMLPSLGRRRPSLIASSPPRPPVSCAPSSALCMDQLQQTGRRLATTRRRCPAEGRRAAALAGRPARRRAPQPHGRGLPGQRGGPAGRPGRRGRHAASAHPHRERLPGRRRWRGPPAAPVARPGLGGRRPARVRRRHADQRGWVGGTTLDYICLVIGHEGAKARLLGTPCSAARLAARARGSQVNPEP
jgi:hypothetical protein